MKQQLKAQRQGGRLLGQVKKQLLKAAKVGVSLGELDRLAEELLLRTGGKPSFQMVPGYRWSTCINVNEGIVHGIPHDSLTIKSGDLVTIDVGLYYKGYHTDTSTSLVVGESKPKVTEFLELGRSTLTQAIAQARAGNRVGDISKAIQIPIERSGFAVARDITGHGVGKQLHQEPTIPCYQDRPRELTPRLGKGEVIAVEVMYMMGDWPLVKSPDNWTLITKDGSLSAVFEETVIIGETEPEVVTQIS